jgi:hypothetical protein
VALFIQALMELFVALQPKITALASAGLDAATRAMESTHRAYSTAGMVADIITGVDKDYPGGDPIAKQKLVWDAVAQYVTNHGGVADKERVDKLVQSGVDYLLGVQPQAA